MKIITITGKNLLSVLIIVVLFALAGALLFLVNSDEEKIIETFSVPVSNKIILIDAGHGGSV